MDLAPSPLVSLFDFKAWAHEELFALLATVDDPARQAALQPALRVLNHIHVVDRIFQAHLQGLDHGFAGTNTAEIPPLAALAGAVKAVDAWYCGYVRGLEPAQLREALRFRFTDGDAGRMSREEMLLHVITHGGYHRGQAGQVLRDAGLAPPRELFTRFLHGRQPERRA
ncbi:DinB family protein [Pelomonas sp. CA6]|uniref:DinB family protein n=1 Tax=Pelomonas sp. CA6 TaxID=2907999 RepID=UPI001F4BED67|nr:DinB family protein [Pelomonas sp. CA6]MCH7345685.1 DinB family protein [Pelomonas sp. CA6]